MAASTRHILINVERMAGDDELQKLWNREATAKRDDGTDRSPQEAWAQFVAAADAAKIADRIPGSVGRTFKTQYASEPAKRATPSKSSTKAAGK